MKYKKIKIQRIWVIIISELLLLAIRSASDHLRNTHSLQYSERMKWTQSMQSAKKENEKINKTKTKINES